jgi:hypothetical protein
MRTSPNKPRQPKGPAFSGYHTHQPDKREHYDPNLRVLGIFRAHHSPEQRNADAKMIAALIGPGIMQHYSHTGETRLEKERAYFPSRTRLESIEAVEGGPGYAIVGGWVTRQEALAELSGVTPVAAELPTVQLAEQAA